MFIIRSLLAWLTISVGAIFFGTIALVAYWIPPRGRWWFTCAHLWGASFLKVAGIRVEADGPEVSPPFVYIGNHESLLDIPVLLVSLPHSARFLAKKILFHIPWVGWNIRMAGFVPIDRSHRRQARRAIEATSRRIRSGGPVLVFAEETRSPDGILLPFQKGGFLLATLAEVPIVPLGIDGTRKLLRKGGFWIHPGTVRVRWGEPIATAGVGRQGRNELIGRVRKQVQALRGGGPQVTRDVASDPGKVELRNACDDAVTSGE